jgi:hypothetical protein
MKFLFSFTKIRVVARTFEMGITEWSLNIESEIFYTDESLKST